MTYFNVWFDSHLWHVAFVCVTWLIHARDMTCSNVWHDSFILVTRIISMRDVTHRCNVTHPYVWRDSAICVRWLINMCHDAFWCVSHDPFLCMTWLIHLYVMTPTGDERKKHETVRHNPPTRDMTRSNPFIPSHTWHELLIRVPWRIKVVLSFYVLPFSRSLHVPCQKNIIFHFLFFLKVMLEGVCNTVLRSRSLHLPHQKNNVPFFPPPPFF